MTDSCCPIEKLPILERSRLCQVAQLARALADDTRLALLLLLAQHGGPLCVCHLVEYVGVSQPTVSHHLRVLREAGLVSVERRGTWGYYQATPQARELLAALERVAARSLTT